MKTCLGWRLKFTYVLLFNLIASPVVLAKQCYNRDGSIELTHTPCLDAPRNTHCCQPGAACLANGLCFLEDNSSLNTGTCTEQGWDELSCFQTCFESKLPENCAGLFSYLTLECLYPLLTDSGVRLKRLDMILTRRAPSTGAMTIFGVVRVEATRQVVVQKKSAPSSSSQDHELKSRTERTLRLVTQYHRSQR